MEIDNLTTARRKSTIKMVYRGYTKTGPPELNSMFAQYLPNRSLRSEDQMLILPPVSKLKFTDRDIAVRGCNYWNPLPLSTKSNKDLKELKLKLKKYGTTMIDN